MYKTLDLDLLYPVSSQQDLQRKYTTILSSEAMVEIHLNTKLANIGGEGIYTLFLTTQHHLIKMRNHYIGPLKKAKIPPQMIINEAVKLGATRIILVHHNPTGNTVLQDRHATMANLMKSRLSQFALRLDDFFVVSQNNLFNNGSGTCTVSMARLGLL